MTAHVLNVRIVVPLELSDAQCEAVYYAALGAAAAVMPTMTDAEVERMSDESGFSLDEERS